MLQLATTATQNLRLDLVMQSMAPGTCGELVQGYLDGQDFLVNCPIDLYSTATLYDSNVPGLWIHEAHRYGKVLDAVTRILDERDLELHHALQITTDIPRSKGMASSTADLSCALAAICKTCNIRWSEDDFASHVASIEPSDCVHFEGIACVDQLRGTKLKSWPAPHGLRVIAVDCGGEIETLEFDRERARSIYRAHDQEAKIRFALSSLGRALLDNDLAEVARAATISAELSQKILHKPIFAELRERMMDAGALGINCAHSGTILGVLYEASHRRRDYLLHCIETHFGPDLSLVGDFEVIGGGCYGA